MRINFFDFTPKPERECKGLAFVTADHGVALVNTADVVSAKSLYDEVTIKYRNGSIDIHKVEKGKADSVVEAIRRKM